ncbi:hypothetical protein FUA48_09805 [Flavobacterium alkalisoli]|uniref:LexA repressor DNA-binding domain-containing protein n=1 Tax=Flavobacterium alkalisoli TaxID=2602769 RepID=A0A5B9FUC9_9FLAO|nr:hypothetical protein [Flavobacterium alkalisoli]QEE49869.1 hypothetical protein FUA48_09805 [Flavobacterium alkalisoli]
MRLPEKKDLFLRELYRLKDEDNYRDVTKTITSAHLAFPSLLSVRRMIGQLKDNGLIELYKSKGFWRAKLTWEGIAFCESTSFAYPDHPVIVREERTRRRLK